MHLGRAGRRWYEQGLAIARLVGDAPECRGSSKLAVHAAIVPDGLLGHLVDLCLVGIVSDERLQQSKVGLHHLLCLGTAHDVAELLLDAGPLTFGVGEFRDRFLVLFPTVEELSPVSQSLGDELALILALVEGNDSLEESRNRVETPSVLYEQRGVLVQHLGFELRLPVRASPRLLELVLGSGVIVQQTPDQRQHEPVASSQLDRLVALTGVDHVIRLAVECPDGTLQWSLSPATSFNLPQHLS